MGIQVQLDNEDIEKVINFCNQVKVSPQRFGQPDSTFRNKDIMFRDMLVGKCGEVAFQKFLFETYGIKADIDWEIYDREIGDKQDILLGGLFRFEMKSIKHGNWFLIEKDTLKRRKAEKTLPHYYVLVKVPYDNRTKRPKNQATIMGYCSFDRLVDEKNILKKGSLLPNTNTPTPLEAENYGLHCTELLTNWTMLFYSLKDIQNQFNALALIKQK